MVGQGGLVGGVWGKANPPGQGVGALGVEGGVLKLGPFHSFLINFASVPAGDL